MNNLGQGIASVGLCIAGAVGMYAGQGEAVCGMVLGGLFMIWFFGS